jgi:hypothetical protein
VSVRSQHIVRKFPLQSLAIVNVQGLQDDESRQQTARLGGIVPVALQLGDKFCLPRDMFFARCDMLAGLHETLKLEPPVHALN